MGLVSFVAGVGIGVGIGVNASSRLRRAVAPATYARRVGTTAAVTVNRFTDAFVDARDAQRAREAELGDTYLR